MNRESSLRLGRLLMINAGVLGILLVFIEGLASLLLFVRASVSIPRDVAAWHHTVYDRELGWVSAPSIFAPNMYGRGMDLRTNSQGFRHDGVVHGTPAAGLRRIICSGDSFTFGYGVGNDHTWCHRLGAMDPCLETVNLGQGGYGLDQAYLRYRRDAARLEHDLHLFAFITDDFARAASKSFQGYGKPLLKVRDGALEITNVPVPRKHRYESFLVQVGRRLAALRTFELVTKVSRRLRASSVDDQQQWPGGQPQSTRTIVAKVLEEVNRITVQRTSKLALIYLPTPWDHHAGNTTQAWMEFVERQAELREVPLINVLAEHRHLPASVAARLFGQHQHLSVDGNRYAAIVIHRKLMTSFPGLLSDEKGQCGASRGRGTSLFRPGGRRLLRRSDMGQRGAMRHVRGRAHRMVLHLSSMEEADPGASAATGMPESSCAAAPAAGAGAHRRADLRLNDAGMDSRHKVFAYRAPA